MAIKTLLACLTNKENAEAVMKCAVPLARAHGAHLVGLHTSETLLVYPSVAMHVPDMAFASFNESQNEEATVVEAIFRKHIDNEDFPSAWRHVKADVLTAAECMIESAHAADLVMMSNESNAHERSNQERAHVRVVRECGRPVIVVPPEFDGPPIGNSFVLGWSNTREAARAAHDLVAVAGEDCEISVVRVDGGGGDELADSQTVDLAEMFDRHGIRAQIFHKSRGGQNIASVLLKHAFEQGADLVAAGAFGHSRAYDFVIGAVTHSLLREAKLPVLFSA